MSFWSGLGKILSIAGPIAAIPFTGGASMLGELTGLGAGAATGLGAGIGAAGGILGHTGGNSGSASAANGLPSGATLQQLLPMLLPLIQKSGNYADQSYQMGLQRYMQADPLRQSLLSMSNGLMPRMYQQPMQGFNLPSSMPPMQQPVNQAVPRQRIG